MCEPEQVGNDPGKGAGRQVAAVKMPSTRVTRWSNSWRRERQERAHHRRDVWQARDLHRRRGGPGDRRLRRVSSCPRTRGLQRDPRHLARTKECLRAACFTQIHPVHPARQPAVEALRGATVGFPKRAEDCGRVRSRRGSRQHLERIYRNLVPAISHRVQAPEHVRPRAWRRLRSVGTASTSTLRGPSPVWARRPSPQYVFDMARGASRATATRCRCYRPTLPWVACGLTTSGRNCPVCTWPAGELLRPRRKRLGTSALVGSVRRRFVFNTISDYAAHCHAQSWTTAFVKALESNRGRIGTLMINGTRSWIRSRELGKIMWECDRAARPEIYRHVGARRHWKNVRVPRQVNEPTGRVAWLTSWNWAELKCIDALHRRKVMRHRAESQTPGRAPAPRRQVPRHVAAGDR